MTEKNDQCGLSYTVDVLQGKWQSRIIFWLGIRTFTGDELLRVLPGITSKELDKELAKLQNLRVVNPIKDEENKYSLTDTGIDLRNIMVAMAVWGLQEMDDTDNRVSAQIVEPDPEAPVEDLVKYNDVLDKYLYR